MRKNVFGRQFSRDTNERKSLFKSLISSLILQERIKTTVEKAKAIKGDVDKIINKAKKRKGKLAVQFLQRCLGRSEMDKVINDLAPRFKDRTSGYTRIIKLGRRFSDNAAMVVMEWVVKPEVKEPASQRGEQKSDVKGLPAGKAKEEPKAKEKTVKTVKKETKRKVAKK
jgi:large subunit ribosomal protein L17